MGTLNLKKEFSENKKVLLVLLTIYSRKIILSF